MHIAAPWCEARSWQTSPQLFIVSTSPCTDCCNNILGGNLCKDSRIPSCKFSWMSHMLFAQRQNSPHELGQNPVANGIGEYPHWVHESLVFTKPFWSVFLASQKRVVLSFPAETICQTDMAVKASTFHFAARLDLIHQWGTHPSLLPALPGTFGCQVSCFLLTKAPVD